MPVEVSQEELDIAFKKVAKIVQRNRGRLGAKVDYFPEDGAPLMAIDANGWYVRLCLDEIFEGRAACPPIQNVNFLNSSWDNLP
jgi:hypothetical protein